MVVGVMPQSPLRKYGPSCGLQLVRNVPKRAFRLDRGNLGPSRFVEAIEPFDLKRRNGPDVRTACPAMLAKTPERIARCPDVEQGPVCASESVEAGGHAAPASRRCCSSIHSAVTWPKPFSRAAVTTAACQSAGMRPDDAHLWTASVCAPIWSASALRVGQESISFLIGVSVSMSPYNGRFFHSSSMETSSIGEARQQAMMRSWQNQNLWSLGSLSCLPHG